MAKSLTLHDEDSLDAGHAARKKLCERIVTCPTALNILRNAGATLDPADLRCAPVVLSQLMHQDCPPASSDDAGADIAGRWLVPEPWNGRLGNAPLLFIGQNPSASFREHYPSLAQAASTSAMQEYFDTRFDGLAIRGGTRVKLKDEGKGNDYAGPNRFLSYLVQIAARLHGRPAKPGIDYALTEGVRCKSKDAIGVELAVGTCARRYMRETLALSPANVIVCLGAIARQSLLTAFECRDAPRKVQQRFAFGTSVPLSVLDGSSDHRQILFLRHSAAFGAPQDIDPSIVAMLNEKLARPPLAESAPVPILRSKIK